MQRANVMQLLVRHKEHLYREFGVTRLALFGSTARDAAKEGSDVDLLVGWSDL